MLVFGSDLLVFGSDLLAFRVCAGPQFKIQESPYGRIRKSFGCGHDFKYAVVALTCNCLRVTYGPAKRPYSNYQHGVVALIKIKRSKVAFSRSVFSSQRFLLNLRMLAFASM